MNMLKDCKSANWFLQQQQKKLQWIKKVNGEATQIESCQSMETYEPYLDTYFNKQAVKNYKIIIKM